MWNYIINSVTGFVFNGLASCGYWVCLIVALVGHFAYISGFKNGARYTTLSTAIYTTIQAISGAIK